MAPVLADMTTPSPPPSVSSLEMPLSPALSGSSAASSQQQQQREKRIRVCVRVRPFTKNEEVKAGGKAAWTWHENTIYQQIFPAQIPSRAKANGGPSSPTGGTTSPSIKPETTTPPTTSSSSSSSSSPRLPSSYSFDRLYGPTTPTRQLYREAVRDTIISAVDGYHSSVFVYGQTGTGKTYTMQGSHDEPGLIQLATQDIFGYIARNSEAEFLLRFSYMEVYNERVYDLLAGGARADLKIYEVERQQTARDLNESFICNDVVLKGLTEEIVVSVDHVLSLVESGNYHRHTATTETNDESSLSHTIFRLVIESQTRETDGTPGMVRSATLNLVDLAGSESVRLTANTDDARHINRSLLTLGHIIWKLSRGRSKSSSSGESTSQQLPYRNSKLTRILQPALGGQAKIALVCTIAPSVECLSETHSTLKFATRARRVKSRAAINEASGESALLRKYRARIRELEEQWHDLERRKTTTAARDTQAVVNLATIEERQVELKFAIENINRVILNSSHRYDHPHHHHQQLQYHHHHHQLKGLDSDDDNASVCSVSTSGKPPIAVSASSSLSRVADTKPHTVSSDSDHSLSPVYRSEPTAEPTPAAESEHDTISVSSRRNLSMLSNGSSLRSTGLSRPSLTTVLKSRYLAELERFEHNNASETAAPPTPETMLRDFVRGLEVAEAENETRLSQIFELELENRHLRELLQQRDAELAAWRASHYQQTTNQSPPRR